MDRGRGTHAKNVTCHTARAGERATRVSHATPSAAPSMAAVAQTVETSAPRCSVTSAERSVESAERDDVARADKAKEERV